jgi:hypothetical protein
VIAMLPRGWESLLRDAMEEAGLAPLPPAKRRRIAETVAGRLELHGIEPELHNWGGVLCGRAVHDNCCAAGGRRLQRFKGDADGARRLVELSCHYTGAVPVVAGFRSELRTDGLFGPSEEAARTFQELAASWAGLEAEVGVSKLRSSFTKDSYAAWLAFRDKWKSGDEDTTALGAMVADLNVTRQNLGRARADIRPPDVTQTTPVLKTFAKVDDAAREVTRAASSAATDTWRAVPLSVKVGAAGVAVAVLSVLLAALKVMR